MRDLVKGPGRLAVLTSLVSEKENPMAKCHRDDLHHAIPNRLSGSIDLLILDGPPSLRFQTTIPRAAASSLLRSNSGRDSARAEGHSARPLRFASQLPALVIK